MWLLDANMDVHLIPILSAFGIVCASARERGWSDISNGNLVAAAVSQGFVCMLTRDRLFGESASRALKANPNFAVVLVTLPQQRWQEYCNAFSFAWQSSPIEPQAGYLITWP